MSSPRIALWNVGGGSQGFGSGNMTSETFWKVCKDNAALMYNASGLVCLVESGPSHGKYRDPPTWVVSHWDDALASSNAAPHRYMHMLGCTLIIDDARWAVEPATTRKMFPDIAWEDPQR